MNHVRAYRRERWNRYTPWLCLLAAFILFAPRARAQGADGRLVRVGYTPAAGYAQGSADAYRSGCSYEYLQQISYYSGWRYEYVDGTLAENLARLRAGEIDLMCGLPYNEQQSDYIAFSARAQGRRDIFLYSRPADRESGGGTPDPLRGSRVGVVEDTCQRELYDAWSGRHGLQCLVIAYPDSQAQLRALAAGEVDLIAADTLVAGSGAHTALEAIAQLGEEPFYFGVSRKSDPAISAELDAAMNALCLSDPGYDEEVFQRCAAPLSPQRQLLSGEERDWLSGHGQVVTVGYLRHCMPLCGADADTGELTGVLADIQADMRARYQIRFESAAFESYDELRAALLRGELDVIFPAHGDYWVAEQQELAVSRAAMSATLTLVFQGDAAPELRRVAVTDADPFQRGGAALYCPDAQLVACADLSAAAEAVAQGRADGCFVLKSCREYARRADGDALASAPLGEISVSFALRRREPALLSLINKLLLAVGEARMNDYLVERSLEGVVLSSRDYRQARAFPLTGALAVIALLLVSSFASLSVSSRRHNRRLLAAAADAEGARDEAQAAFRELRRQIELTREWQQVSETDALTGLLNRGGGERRIRALLCQNAVGLFCLLDVDAFKRVNDDFGHDAGDAALRGIAGCMRAAFRDNDVLVRFGGDEFVIFAAGISDEGQAKRCLDRFLLAIGALEIPGFPGKRVTVSLGACLRADGDHRGFEALYRCADNAMYCCKDGQPCSRYVFC